jgi:hypothetical protein
MIRARILPMSIAWVVISTPLISAQDLSRYREFQLGMSLVAVAQQVGITPEGRVLHQRPGLIQELMWLPPLGSSRQGDSARKVVSMVTTASSSESWSVMTEIGPKG